MHPFDSHIKVWGPCRIDANNCHMWLVSQLTLNVGKCDNWLSQYYMLHDKGCALPQIHIASSYFTFQNFIHECHCNECPTVGNIWLRVHWIFTSYFPLQTLPVCRATPMHSRFGWWEVATPHKGEWRCIVMDSGAPSAAQVGLDLMRQRLCAGSWGTRTPLDTDTWTCEFNRQMTGK